MRNKKSKIMAIALVAALLLAIIPVGIFTVSAGPIGDQDFGYFYFYDEEAGDGLELALYNGSGGDVVIPDSFEGNPVKAIGYAFTANKELTGIKIPNSVTDIIYGAFMGCSNLKNVELPNKIKSIEQNTFTGCESLTEIKIPEGVTRIGAGAFSMCSKLASVSLPASIKEIEVNAFEGCDALVEVNYAGTSEQKNAINIGSYNSGLSKAKWNTTDDKKENSGSEVTNTDSKSNDSKNTNTDSKSNDSKNTNTDSKSNDSKNTNTDSKSSDSKKAPTTVDSNIDLIIALLLAVMGGSIIVGSVHRKKRNQ